MVVVVVVVVVLLLLLLLLLLVLLLVLLATDAFPFARRGYNYIKCIRCHSSISYLREMFSRMCTFSTICSNMYQYIFSFAIVVVV